jgi:hypothetical protein
MMRRSSKSLLNYFICIPKVDDILWELAEGAETKDGAFGGGPSGQPISYTQCDVYKTYLYAQAIPVTSYLLAFIVGELKSAKIGRASTLKLIYSEPMSMNIETVASS